MKRARIRVLAAVLGIVALAVVAVVALQPVSGAGSDSNSTPDATALPFATQAPRPPETAQPTGPGLNDRVDQQWAAATAKATGIPLKAVIAYAGATLGVTDNFPDCTIGWNTLAGIGKVESDHARFGGATIDAIGHVEPKIFGVPLTGGEVENIPDTDGGEFDETAEFDRAIGPMQIIPSTWRSWPADGNGDGVPDPHNIYDATISAANYLCHAESDWESPEGWRAGVAAYNTHTEYAAAVASAAQQYADDIAK